MRLQVGGGLYFHPHLWKNPDRVSGASGERGVTGRALTTLILVASLLACGNHPPQHLVLISIDTLRRDGLSAYGAQSASSPTLDQLARIGVRFDDALTQAVSTPPSHASMMTGLNPPSYGLRRLSGQRLPEVNVTLAEVLSEAGFVTAAFVSAVPLRREVGLDQGFALYDDCFEPARERPAEQSNSRVQAWLGTRPSGRLFLWVHYFDPHWPYFAPARFREGVSEGRTQRKQVARALNGNPETGSGQTAPVATVHRMRNLYRAEVSYVDHSVGELLRMLDAAGVREDAVIAVVSDHGECLGENGYFFGHWDVFDETARVPMILVRPDGAFAGRVVNDPVGTIDLMPTLLRWLEVEAPPGLDGIDLTGLIEGRAGPQRSIYTEQVEYFSSQAVRESGFALIARPGTPTGRLYRRERGRLGAEMSDDLGGQNVARLARALEAVTEAAMAPASERLEVPESVAEQLRGLGYVE